MPLTPRLVLRPSLPGDVEALHAILGSGRVMKHSTRDATPRETAARIRASEAQRRSHGFAAWTAILRGGFEIVGWGGLFIDPADPEWGPEVGYYLARKHWGQGLAGEMVAAALFDADRVHCLPVVTAFARRQNAPSIRVLERAGFVEAGYIEKLDRLEYRRERPDPVYAMAAAPRDEAALEAPTESASETKDAPAPKPEPAAQEDAAGPETPGEETVEATSAPDAAPPSETAAVPEVESDGEPATDAVSDEGASADTEGKAGKAARDEDAPDKDAESVSGTKDAAADAKQTKAQP